MVDKDCELLEMSQLNTTIQAPVDHGETAGRTF